MPNNQSRNNILPPIRRREQNRREQSQREENSREENQNEREKENDDPPETCIRKYKKIVRRIERLKKLNKEIKNEAITEINRLNANKKCYWVNVIRFIAFSIVILTDILLPICFDKDNDIDYTSSVDEAQDLEDTGLTLAVEILLVIPVTVICSSYTVIIIYATKRRKYITGDYLYDKQINDDISLLKTVQLVCGYSFALLYCNLYFWRSIDVNGHYGRPNFYDETIIPDYTFIRGISIVMILKIAVIALSILGGLFCSKFSVFKNDLAEYNLVSEFSTYDNEYEFNQFLQQKSRIVKMLNS